MYVRPNDMPGLTCGALYSKLVHNPRLVMRKSEGHRMKGWGWVIAGENVKSTWTFTAQHAGVHPTKLLHGLGTRRRRNFGLQVKARALTSIRPPFSFQFLGNPCSGVGPQSKNVHCRTRWFGANVADACVV
jgi:hypothetical protein